MLKRFRIEVEEASAADTQAALDRYEEALCQDEGLRFSLADADPRARWEELGREVTEEVIEYVPDWPGYKGRRVVKFTRVDTRDDPSQYAVTSALDMKVEAGSGHVPPSAA